MHALAFAGGEGAVDDEAGGRVFVVDVVVGGGVAGDVGGGGARAGFVYLLGRGRGVSGKDRWRIGEEEGVRRW